ncbi:CUE domain-containing protein LALA0_S01e16886g [Lachancea lanzarotensis]|uniref:LALA0S01e16886g1_1 n=1 Tax=Lachancea lanzarotensis TaxID=1245769 RepID=A0A0C7MYR4_9SACH|nr:uncharacterized protein LALA0_S01e16886g [Lachancea lanzarotensis]CEP60697.1 LALA0S01e16886g1_1 [Lachancea lanzarotensis]
MAETSGTKETVEDVPLVEEAASSGETKDVENSAKTEIQSKDEKKLAGIENSEGKTTERAAEKPAEKPIEEQAEPVSESKGKIDTTEPAVSTEKPKLSEATTKKENMDYADEELPPLPKRNSSNTQVVQNPILAELTEAFPNVEAKYVKAVLIASSGALDPAFSALLYLSDPTFEAEAAIPSAPPQTDREGPVRSSKGGRTQFEQDELLARQLDAQFNKSRSRHAARQEAEGGDERAARESRIRRRQREYERRTAQGQRPMNPEEQRYYDELGHEANDDDFLSQFVEKDLPEIRDRVGRQVQETGKKVNEWFTGIRKNWTQEQQPQESQYEDYPEFSQRNNAAQRSHRRNSSNRSSGSDNDKHVRPEQRNVRFNSFGAKEGDDSADTSQRLASHGISIFNKMDSDERYGDNDEDVAPQLPSRNKQPAVEAETTYIDTPETATRKKWQPLPPEPINLTPSKVNATASKDKKKAYKDEENDFLINSDDEL